MLRCDLNSIPTKPPGGPKLDFRRTGVSPILSPVDSAAVSGGRSASPPSGPVTPVPRGELGKALADLLDRALSIDVAQRPASARAFEAELAAIKIGV